MLSLSNSLSVAKSYHLPDNRYMIRTWKKIQKLCIFVLTAGLALHSVSYAQSPSSNNFQLKESVIGSGGLNDANSANFNITNSIGDLGVGNSASANYQVEAGSQTTELPTLSFALEGGPANFGILTPTAAATATTSFSIKNYTSYGYVVQVSGPTPTNGTTSIHAMTTPGSSIPGTSQFGMNLTANTDPSVFGANPDNGQFGFGEVDPDYITPNTYSYIDGDIIARAPKSSGTTIYTISYILNVEPLTPGGQYRSGQVIIITGTY